MVAMVGTRGIDDGLVAPLGTIDNSTLRSAGPAYGRAVMHSDSSAFQALRLDAPEVRPGHLTVGYLAKIRMTACGRKRPNAFSSCAPAVLRTPSSQAQAALQAEAHVGGPVGRPLVRRLVP